MLKRKIGFNKSFRKNRGNNSSNGKNLFMCGDCSRQNFENVKEKKSQIDDLSNNVLISYGTRGKEVEEVQKKLLDLTNIYSNLPVVTSDGIFSDNTKRAIKKFQQLNALDITGELDKATLKRINEIHECNKEDIEISETRQENGVNYINQSKNQLEMGDKGEYVVYLQKYLNIVSNKYPSISKLNEDGKFEEKTGNSVKEFQRLFNLQVDGKVDDITWNALYNATK